MKKAILLAIGNDCPRDEWADTVLPPLGILAVGSYLVAHDVPVELIDVHMDFGFGLTAAVERTVARRVAQYLHTQADDIAWIGISQHSNTSSGVTVAQEVHTTLPEMPIVFGGYFPSSCYRPLLEEQPGITSIVRGDGEAAALEISQSLDQGRSFLSERTPNLAWRDEGNIRTTPIQPIPLNDLPISDFGLLHNPSCYRVLSIITSRGCPFRCNYCLENGMRPYAEYPLDWVTQQLTNMETRTSAKHTVVHDPIFGVDRKRTLELCRILGEYDFVYGIQSRVDVLTPEIVPALSQAGVESVYFGMESASPETLLRMGKVHSVSEAERYVQSALEVFKACFENGLAPFLGLMVAFPGDSEADHQATVEFVRKAQQLRNQVATQTGVNTPFVPYGWHTHVYDGSPLAGRVNEDFPETVLYSEPYVGERTVLSPSSGIELEQIRRYQEEIDSLADQTPEVYDLLERYWGFSRKEFAEAHPELTDDQGVTVLCESVKPGLAAT
jgi:anaerobic magnesium-protoporphyrin IX monomethyl ester cyclase